MKTIPNNQIFYKNVFLSRLNRISLKPQYVLFFFNFSNKDKLYELSKDFLEFTSQDSNTNFENTILIQSRFVDSEIAELAGYHPCFPAKKALKTDLFQQEGSAVKEIKEKLDLYNIDDQQILNIFTKKKKSLFKDPKWYNSFAESSLLIQGGERVNMEKLKLFESKSIHYVTSNIELPMKQANEEYKKEMFEAQEKIKKNILTKIIDRYIGKKDFFVQIKIIPAQEEKVLVDQEMVFPEGEQSLVQKDSQKITLKPVVLNINESRQIDRNILVQPQVFAPDFEPEIKQKNQIMSFENPNIENVDEIPEKSIVKYGLDLFKRISGMNQDSTFETQTEKMMVVDGEIQRTVIEKTEIKEGLHKFKNLFVYDQVAKTGVFLLPDMQQSSFLDVTEEPNNSKYITERLNFLHNIFGGYADQISDALREFMEAIYKDESLAIKLQSQDETQQKVKKNLLIDLLSLTEESPANMFFLINLIPELKKVETLAKIFEKLWDKGGMTNSSLGKTLLLKDLVPLYDSTIPIKDRINQTTVFLQNLDKIIELFTDKITKKIHKLGKMFGLTDLAAKTINKIKEINFGVTFSAEEKQDMLDFVAQKTETGDFPFSQKGENIIEALVASIGAPFSLSNHFFFNPPETIESILINEPEILNKFFRTLKRFDFKNGAKYSPLVFTKVSNIRKTCLGVDFHASKLNMNFNKHEILIVKNDPLQNIVLSSDFQKLDDFPKPKNFKDHLLFFSDEKKQGILVETDKKKKTFSKTVFSKEKEEKSLEEQLSLEIKSMSNVIKQYFKDTCKTSDEYQIKPLDQKVSKMIDKIREKVSQLQLPQDANLILQEIQIGHLKKGKNPYNEIINPIFKAGRILQRNQLVLGTYKKEIEIKQTNATKALETIEKMFGRERVEEREIDIKTIDKMFVGEEKIKAIAEDQDDNLKTQDLGQGSKGVQNEVIENKDIDQQLQQQMPQVLLTEANIAKEVNPKATFIVLLTAINENIVEKESALLNRKEGLLATIKLLDSDPNYMKNLVSITSAGWLNFIKDKKILNNLCEIQNDINEKREEIGLKAIIEVLFLEYVLAQCRSFFSYEPKKTQKKDRKEGKQTKDKKFFSQQAYENVDRFNKFCELSLTEILEKKPQNLEKEYFSAFEKNSFESFFNTHISELFFDLQINQIDSLNTEQLKTILENLKTKIKETYVCGIHKGKFINRQDLIKTLTEQQ